MKVPVLFVRLDRRMEKTGKNREVQTWRMTRRSAPAAVLLHEPLRALPGPLGLRAVRTHVDRGVKVVQCLESGIG